MERQPVDSSQIAAIGHDPETNTLEIEFKSAGSGRPNTVYQYSNFTAEDFALFKAAESTGSHFYRNIKPFTAKYPYKKVE